MATNQETFDAVVTHLRRQGRKALSARGKCAYRGEDGTKCAAGCVLPDDKYRPDFEGASVYGIRGVFIDLGHSVPLLSELQTVHDTLAPSDWENSFRAIARQFLLTYTPPEPAQ